MLTAVGAATDILTRFFVPFLEKHIPGNPSVRVRNMPGGGTLLGMNWFAANAKPDGTMVLASTVASQVAYILRNPVVRYDFRKLRPVLVNGSGAVFYAAALPGLGRAADLPKATGLTFGSNTPPGVELPALLAFELLGVEPKVVFGFESRGPIRPAFERGELNLDFQATFVYRSQVLPLVQQRKVVPLMTLGFLDERGRMVRDPAVSDLPTVYEVYQEIHGRKPEGLLRWKAYPGLVAASWTYGRALSVPQETPAGGPAGTVRRGGSHGGRPRVPPAGRKRPRPVPRAAGRPGRTGFVPEHGHDPRRGQIHPRDCTRQIRSTYLSRSTMKPSRPVQPAMERLRACRGQGSHRAGTGSSTWQW